MRKTAKLFSALAFLSFVMILNVSAQEKTFEKGSTDINLGIGFGSPWLGGGYYMAFPPVSLSVDYGLRDDLGPGVIGIGGLIGYSSYRYTFYEDYGWTYSTVIFGVRGTYHYQLVDKLDTYGGVIIGFRTITTKEYGTWPPQYEYFDENDVKFSGSLFIGAKYHFTDKVAAFGELGYGIGIVTMGVTYILK